MFAKRVVEQDEAGIISAGHALNRKALRNLKRLVADEAFSHRSKVPRFGFRAQADASARLSLQRGYDPRGSQ